MPSKFGGASPKLSHSGIACSASRTLRAQQAVKFGHLVPRKPSPSGTACPANWAGLRPSCHIRASRAQQAVITGHRVPSKASHPGTACPADWAGLRPSCHIRATRAQMCVTAESTKRTAMGAARLAMRAGLRPRGRI